MLTSCRLRPAYAADIPAMGALWRQVFGDSEEVKLTHRADSRRIFAAGALRAAKALAAREPGFYTFEEILFTQEEQ